MMKRPDSMFSYLILFSTEMIDVTSTATQDWLATLARDGRLVSVDELEEQVVRLTTNSKEPDHRKHGFALINARSQDELNSILRTCPNLYLDGLEIYQLK